MYTLTHKGYSVSLKHALIDKIKDELTFIEKETDYNINKPKLTIKCFWMSKNNLYVPRMYGQSKFKEIVYNYPNAKKITCEFKGSLREYQTEIVENVIHTLNNPYKQGGLLHMGAGTGKTVTSLYLVSKLKSKTIIIVHTKMLMNQWIERIKTFLPDVSIGIIQEKKMEIECDIVIGMIQTMCKNYKNYTHNTFSSFECLIVDESQRICAKQFSQVLHKLQCKYRLALTATPRKDNFQNVINYHVGSSIAQYSKDLYVPSIQINQLSVSFMIPKKYDGKCNYSKFLNLLSYHAERNEKIVNVIYKIQDEYNFKRKMIVFVQRVQQAKDLCKLIKEKCSTLKVTILIGSLKKKERQDAIEHDIIIATYKIAVEGVDIPKLECLVLAAPIGGEKHVDSITKKESYGNIEQVVGRILRKKNEFKPLVVDFKDSNSLWPTKKQYYQRLKFYKDKKYKIWFKTEQQQEEQQQKLKFLIQQ